MKAFATPSIIVLIVLGIMAIVLTGFRTPEDIYTNQELGILIDRISILANEVAKRAREGKLSSEEMIRYLELHVQDFEILKQFKDRSKGNVPLNDLVDLIHKIPSVKRTTK